MLWQCGAAGLAISPAEGIRGASETSHRMEQHSADGPKDTVSTCTRRSGLLARLPKLSMYPYSTNKWALKGPK